MDVSVVSVVCCQVEVHETDWSLVQRSPTDCGASLCVIKKPRTRGGYSPARGLQNTNPQWVVAPVKSIYIMHTRILQLVCIHNDILHVSANHVAIFRGENTKDGYIRGYKTKVHKNQNWHRLMFPSFTLEYSKEYSWEHTYELRGVMAIVEQPRCYGLVWCSSQYGHRLCDNRRLRLGIK